VYLHLKVTLIMGINIMAFFCFKCFLFVGKVWIETKTTLDRMDFALRNSDLLKTDNDLCGCETFASALGFRFMLNQYLIMLLRIMFNFFSSYQVSFCSTTTQSSATGIPVSYAHISWAAETTVLYARGRSPLISPLIFV